MKQMEANPPSLDNNNKENKGWRPGQGGWPDVEIRLPHNMHMHSQVSKGHSPAIVTNLVPDTKWHATSRAQVLVASVPGLAELLKESVVHPARTYSEL